MAHEEHAAQLEDVKDQIAEESAKAAAALLGSAAGLSRGSGNRGDLAQLQPKPSPKLADDTKARVVDALIWSS